MRIEITGLQQRMLFLSIAVLAVIASACERAPVNAPTAPAPAAGSSVEGNQAPETTPAAVNAALAELRALTAHFRDLEDAKDAGYTVQVTPCLELPGVGAMGFHYGNPDYLNSATVSELQPELLLYEPQKNGKLRFVGVEYIIPFALLPATADPPVLFGQEMHVDTANGIWALHVWVGRENPTGIFADWNPKVSCEFAE